MGVLVECYMAVSEKKCIFFKYIKIVDKGR